MNRALFSDNKDFYPTPAWLVERMVQGVEICGRILEPSAGKGDIVKILLEWHKNHRYGYDNREIEIDTIEKNVDLANCLRGAGYRVIHDDFLTFESFMRYDLIVMNPPFSAGDRHLMKALELQKNGGKIICLLNAETLRNRGSLLRQKLWDLLTEYDAKIEYLEDEFAGAERETGVEIALIRVTIPEVLGESLFCKNLRDAEEKDYSAIYEEYNIAPSEQIDNLVARYSRDIQAGTAFICEYYRLNNKHFDLSVGGEAFTLRFMEQNKAICRFIKRTRHDYWEELFKTEKFTNAFTSDMMQRLYGKLNEFSEYDVTHYNIFQLLVDLTKNVMSDVENTILALFDELSHKYAWHEGVSNNVHYYDGWSTNKSWFINKRVIVPYMDAWGWFGDFRPTSHSVATRLKDIEKVFDFLDAKRTEHFSLDEALKRAERFSETKKVRTKYFLLTFYKKGTVHIEFLDERLLKKFNLYAAKNRAWLPPSYGKKHYRDMEPEEQRVIDSFEGKDRYEETLRDVDFFLGATDNLVALEEGTGQGESICA